VISSEDDEGSGYLVIEIPPSLSAPHMVEGRYWGRSERTKRQLSDPEVVQLHAARVGTADRINAALDAEIDREPQRGRSRMFLVAEPLLARDGLARDFVRGATRQMLQLANSADVSLPASVADWQASPSDMAYTVRRSQGIACTSLSNGRTFKDEIDEQYAVDLEVKISGLIRAMVSGITCMASINRIPGEVPFIRQGVPVAWAHRMVRFATNLGATLDYRGPWGFGIQVYGLANSRAGLDDMNAFRLPVYEVDHYQAVTTAPATEVQESPRAVVDRLVGDLIHAYGISQAFSDALSPSGD
jgi:hypothetical protein